MSFTNKVVLVTGASSGIGAVTAISFSAEGAKVAIVGRNDIKLNNVAQECTARGTRPLVIKADVSKDDEAKTIVKRTIDHFGKLDILINNAGIVRTKPLMGERTLETFDEVINTNLRAVVLITSLAAPHIVKTKGNIVNVSSIAGLMVLDPAYMAYCVSKAGLDHFTRCAALELANFGVRVNSVNPGPVKTDIIVNSGVLTHTWEETKKMTILDRFGEPEEIADIILFLASDKARSVTGSVYVSDNGTMLKR